MRNARLVQKLRPPGPPGPSQDWRYRQGVVISFDQVTLRNEVRVGTTVLTDLPLLGVADAAALLPGAVVGLAVIDSAQGGMTTYAIVGRFVRPGTPEATDAVTRVSQRIFSAAVADIDSTTSTAYTDLDVVGPAVTVPVGASGRALVLVTTSYLLNMVSPIVPKSANVAYAISGATIRSADDVGFDRGAFFSARVDGTESEFLTRLTCVNLEEGLTPGLNTFTMKYQSGNGESVAFAARHIAVFVL